jgi:hypothetical protein
MSTLLIVTIRREGLWLPSVSLNFKRLDIRIKILPDFKPGDVRDPDAFRKDNNRYPSIGPSRLIELAEYNIQTAGELVTTPAYPGSPDDAESYIPGIVAT